MRLEQKDKIRFMQECKPMIYDESKIDSTVLAQGFYKEYEFFVISLGTHPCAYVRLKQRKYNNYDSYSEKIAVHGGFTYLENDLRIGKDKYIQSSYGFLGWDYAHYEDYYAWIKRKGGKKWTTEEIVNECKYVIEQLIEKEVK